VNSRGEGFLSNLLIGLVIFGFVFTGMVIVIAAMYQNYNPSNGTVEGMNETDILQLFSDAVENDTKSLVSNITEAEEAARAVQEEAPRDPITAVWSVIKRLDKSKDILINSWTLSSRFLYFIHPAFWSAIITIIFLVIALAIVEFWWRRRG